MRERKQTKAEQFFKSRVFRLEGEPSTLAGSFIDMTVKLNIFLGSADRQSQIELFNQAVKEAFMVLKLRDSNESEREKLKTTVALIAKKDRRLIRRSYLLLRAVAMRDSSSLGEITDEETRRLLGLPKKGLLFPDKRKTKS